jgi:hypothetical protein
MPASIRKPVGETFRSPVHGACTGAADDEHGAVLQPLSSLP